MTKNVYTYHDYIHILKDTCMQTYATPNTYLVPRGLDPNTICSIAQQIEIMPFSHQEIRLRDPLKVAFVREELGECLGVQEFSNLLAIRMCDIRDRYKVTVYVNLYVYAYVYMYMCMYMRMCICVCVYVYVYVYMCMCICVRVCVYVYMCMCIFVYVYMCMRICICITIRHSVNLKS